MPSMPSEGHGTHLFNPFTREKLFGYVCTVIGALLIKRLSVTDWLLLMNWVLAAGALVFAFLAFRNQRRHQMLLAGLCLLVQGIAWGYDWYGRAYVSIEWPTGVPSNEAVVGGSVRNLDLANTAVKLYVCVVSGKPACYLDQNEKSPTIREGYWQGQIRFGNEHPDNDHGRPEFFVVAAVVRLDQVPQLPGNSQPVPDSALLLISRLRDLRPRAFVAGPFRVAKTYSGDPEIQLSAIESRGTVIPLPPLREPNYAVCPPVVVTWNGPATGSAVAAVEAWQDGRRHGSAESALTYPIAKWPDGVERIEVKISSASGKGPYDSVWLKRGVCP